MLIDSHCHFPHKKYTKSIDELVKEAEAAGIEKLINIGTSLKENRRSIETTTKFENVFATVSVYPHDDAKKNIEELQPLLQEQINSSPKVVAIGEGGIDVFENWEGVRDLKEQTQLFEMLIQLAIKNKLPLIIHNRNGDKQILELLKEYVPQGLTGVAHCFSQDWEFAQQILDSGFYISFTAIITYPKNEYLREIVRKVPDDRFLVETDAPYLPPQQYRGQVNEPKYVKIVAEKVSEVKNRPFEEIAAIAYENTCRLFKI